jgi:hypothetical protein
MPKKLPYDKEMFKSDLSKMLNPQQPSIMQKLRDATKKMKGVK